MKRTHYIALSLVVLVTLILLNLPSRTAARIKLGIGSLFLPAFGLKGAAQQGVEHAGDALVTRAELLRQNAALRRQNEELLLQSAHGEEMGKENARLRKLLGWQHQQPWKFKAGSVVLREPANWWRAVSIDLGSRDGLTNNLPVLTPDGFLVGRISSVGLVRSQVVLLGDPNCKVAARVDNDAGDTGVIAASGPLDTEFVEMGYLSKNANVKPGQNVKTSGEGGIFPKDIPIGKVIDVRPVEFGLSTVARVKLGANLNALDIVWVRMK